MHTNKINETTFVYNGDYCGDVIIRNDDKAVTVPFSDLKAFVAKYVADKRIERIEDMTDDQILGIPE